jgi:G:T-mismatch repair DNA endonuclease (very short patch repair protein)
MPKSGPNVELWRAKFERTRARDELAMRLADALGYEVIRVLECDIANDAQAVVARIRRMATRRVTRTCAAPQEAVAAT